MDRLGFVGLGTMGKPMARNLLRAGYCVTVHDHFRGPVDELVGEGATSAANPTEAAAASDVTIIMLPDSPDVESVVLGEQGIISGVREGCVVVDMSTVSPFIAEHLAAKLREKRVEFLDAPVTGGQTGAESGSLCIMVGGDESALRRCLPIFQILGKTVAHMGPSGAGYMAKLCNQVICGLNILAVCEGLTLAKASGLDPVKVLKTISGGSAGSWMLSNLAPKMLKRDWSPGFRIALQQKDLRLALEAAAKGNLPLPGTALANQLFRVAEAKGMGDQGTQALIIVLESLGSLSSDRSG